MLLLVAVLSGSVTDDGADGTDGADEVTVVEALILRLVPRVPSSH